jgi:adenosylmethionine-8-amino-7-oxononanoate aminotransferase
MMVGFDIVKDKATREPFPRTDWMSQKVSAAAMERGLIVYPLFGSADGLAGDMIKLSPPLVTTRAQTDEIVDILHQGIRTVLASLV